MVLERDNPTKVRGIGERLGFGKSMGRSLRTLTETTIDWRQKSTNDANSLNASLSTWSSPEVQSHFTGMAEQYLAKDHVQRFWAPGKQASNDQSPYDVLEYPRDKVK